MKELLNKNLIKKTAIVIIFITCFNVLCPMSISRADTFIKISEGKDFGGGSLVQPIMHFLVFIADSVMSILQRNFISEQDVVIQASASENSQWSWGWLSIGLLALVSIGIGIATILTGGLGAVVIGTIVTAGGIAGSIISVSEIASNLGGSFDIPLIAYNPYTIFSGEIPAMDINFINPMGEKLRQRSRRLVYSGTHDAISQELAQQLFSDEEFFLGQNYMFITDVEMSRSEFMTKYRYSDQNGCYWKETLASGCSYSSYAEYWVWIYEGKVYGIQYYYDSNGTIFTNYYCMDAERLDDYDIEIGEYETYYESSAAILQDSIATWYKVLRRIALIGLLSVLVYVGIRIMLTAAAGEKAKYKKMFIDWLIAVCMLFVLHYLMIFILTLATKMSSIFNQAGVYNMHVELPESTVIGAGKHTRNLLDNPDNLDETDNILGIEDSSTGGPIWTGEFVGFIRLLAGYESKKDSTIYGLMYLVLVIDICVFTFMYLRRVLYMAFLTMIAPLVALTYPLDRIKDGKAQAFSMWLKEYIFNALIQPVHLILYTMLISTAISLAVEHPVYALVALGFMMPAEKFIRQMFGFEKASSLNPVGAFAGGALVMQMVNNISRLGRGGGKDKNKEKEQEKVRTQEKGTPDVPEVDFSGQNNSVVAGAAGEQDETQETLTSGDETRDVRMRQRTNGNAPENEQQFEGVRQSLEALRNQRQNGAISPGSNEQSSLRRSARFANAFSSIGNRGRNRMLKAKPLRFAGRLTAMKIGALTFGTVGLAAGISSGDFKNVLGYTAAGGATGALLGKSLGDKAMDRMAEVKEDFKEGYQGNENYNNKKLDKEYFNGQGFQEMLDNHDLMPELKGGARAQELRDQIKVYRSAGITDNKKITQCMKAGLSAKEGTQALRTAAAIKGMGLDKEGLKEYEEEWKAQIGSGFGEAKANLLWEIIRDNI